MTRAVIAILGVLLAAMAGAAPPTQSALQLETAAIRGNQELPKVLYIVPWKDAPTAELAGRPVNSLVEEALAPVDRDVFRRQVRYYTQLQEAAPAASAAQHGE